MCIAAQLDQLQSMCKQANAPVGVHVPFAFMHSQHHALQLSSLDSNTMLMLLDKDNKLLLSYQQPK